MKAFVGVTDNDWFAFLSQQPGIDEVNFWQPGGNRLFKSLNPGEPFLFKLHAPHHYIVGGGFFAHSTILPISLAWQAFGENNDCFSTSSTWKTSGKIPLQMRTYSMAMHLRPSHAVQASFLVVRTSPGSRSESALRPTSPSRRTTVRRRTRLVGR